jgi:hypothetical protein
MKVDLSTTIALPAETVWEEVQTAALLMHIAWPLVRFAPVGSEPLDSFTPGGRYQARLWLFGFLPFGTQWMVISVHEPDSGNWPKRLRDNGHSLIIRTWDHWITITPNPDGTTCYRDEVDVSAGILTPGVWAFAQLFYRHRQRRWRKLAASLHARRLIKRQMADYDNARLAGDINSAWRALERAHIISQPHLGPHLENHRAMLGFAVALRDWREVAGQVVRLILAPLGALTGRIPVGNTGRSNVSAFQPMAIPNDLRRAINDKQP